jgi:hypothetical protein
MFRASVVYEPVVPNKTLGGTLRDRFLSRIQDRARRFHDTKDDHERIKEWGMTPFAYSLARECNAKTRAACVLDPQSRCTWDESLDLCVYPKVPLAYYAHFYPGRKIRDVPRKSDEREY